MSHITDLLDTFYASKRLEQRDLNWLRASSVTPRAMWDPDPMLRAAVRPVGPALFDIVHPETEQAKAAFLLLTRDAMGITSDIVAWNPRLPLLRSLYGRAKILGEDEVYKARLCHDGCLRIWRDPLDWLRADRRGVVLLHGITSAGCLAEIGPLMADDAAHRSDVLRLITRPQPRVHIAPRLQAA
jgi:hypothetical protein